MAPLLQVRVPRNPNPWVPRPLVLVPLPLGAKRINLVSDNTHTHTRFLNFDNHQCSGPSGALWPGRGQAAGSARAGKQATFSVMNARAALNLSTAAMAASALSLSLFIMAAVCVPPHTHTHTHKSEYVLSVCSPICSPLCSVCVGCMECVWCVCLCLHSLVCVSLLSTPRDTGRPVIYLNSCRNVSDATLSPGIHRGILKLLVLTHRSHLNPPLSSIITVTQTNTCTRGYPFWAMITTRR